MSTRYAVQCADGWRVDCPTPEGARRSREKIETLYPDHGCGPHIVVTSTDGKTWQPLTVGAS